MAPKQTVCLEVIFNDDTSNNREKRGGAASKLELL